MEKLKLLSLLSIILIGSCKTPGDIRVYSLDVDNDIMRHEEHPIMFDDERMRCLDTEFGRECRYLCVDADDLEDIIDDSVLE